MLKAVEHSLKLTGSGETKEEAFHNMFTKLKPMIAKEFSNSVVIRIEPRDVLVEAAIEETYTERFLGLFFPRQRKCFCITAHVTVYLHFIELAAVPFEQNPKTASLAQGILHNR